MSQRSARLKKASVLLPLAVLSGAWTVSLTGVDLGAADASRVLAESSTADTTPSDVVSGAVPAAEAPVVPASLSDPVLVTQDKVERAAAMQGAGQRVSPASARSASLTGIPSAALAAYQRAGTVINRADPSCHLSWQLIAALGKVESNHGRYGGNALDAEGAASPGIYGLPLNGTSGTRAIADTDGGQYDRDPRWDRAVGPMQFIPSTWSVVGVDGDGDGVRDPQNVHDAALASAVYLCSGDDDLSTDAGRRSAVFRYNHSTSYVETVLAVMNSYLDGEFTSVPTNTVPSSDTVVTAREPATGGDDAGAGNGKGDGKRDGDQLAVAAGGPGAHGGTQGEQGHSDKHGQVKPGQDDGPTGEPSATTGTTGQEKPATTPIKGSDPKPAPSPSSPKPKPDPKPDPTPEEPEPEVCEPRADELPILEHPDPDAADDPATPEDERCLVDPDAVEPTPTPTPSETPTESAPAQETKQPTPESTAPSTTP
ncbi:lytic murein transglycosylase [Nocardioides insulae]|uniref:lytic murein transglycosylase n=1 Tax=Nocardioides insulae TaxID=394734 RepID=UPI00041051D9|nr:lytic murein transglycosylase [Nocardioides insulae]